MNICAKPDRQSVGFATPLICVGALMLAGTSGCGASDPADSDGLAETGGASSQAGSGSQAAGRGEASGGGTGGGAGRQGGDSSGGSADSAGSGGNGGGSGGAAGIGGSGGSAATGGGGSAGTGGNGGSLPDGGRGGSGDAGGCTVPDPRDRTITPYQTDILARLAGQMEISPGTRLTNRATTANRAAARAYMKTLFQDLGLTPTDHAYGSGTNVYATLPATTGMQTVVFGAHYDSVAVSPGANDNGTGVAAVFAVARYATKLPCRSKALIFVLFDEEEVGLVGSKQFATKLKNDGTMVHSVHTIDQMGWDMDGDRAIELELPDTGLRQLYQAAVSELGVSVALTPTTTASTDHSSFRPTFLAVGLTEEYASRPSDTTPYYHKAGDTFDRVNFAYLLSTTTIINQVVADLTR